MYYPIYLYENEQEQEQTGVIYKFIFVKILFIKILKKIH
jgi:hypothetical protein